MKQQSTFEGKSAADDVLMGQSHSPENSLVDDFSALIEDGKTYAEAELAFQKARLAYVSDRGKSGILFGIIALILLHLALVSLVLGAILALTPEVSAWGATAIVVGVLAIIGAIAGLLAKERFGQAAKGFANSSDRKSAP